MPKVTQEPRVKLGARFADAVAMACRLHRDQARNDDGVPYISHLLAVAALVLEHGGDEDEAIGALLHDAAEDQGGRATLDQIQTLFGPRVAGIVEGCSDTLEREKPLWRPRKENYVGHLDKASPSVRRVAAADKLHNVLSLLVDVKNHGGRAFDRFETSSPQDQVWFYGACAEALLRSGDCVLARRLAEAAELLAKEVRVLELERHGRSSRPGSATPAPR